MKKIIFGFPILILIVAVIIRIVSADAVSIEDYSSFSDTIEKPTSTTTLHYTGFTVFYNPETCQPDWVSYTLTAEHVEQTKHTPKIPRRFMPDPNLSLPQADNVDYSNTGWVKGHMARRQDMKWSEQAVLESDYFTNICPQDKEMNNGVWHQIENLARKVAVTYDSVLIVCGPVFTTSPPRTIGVHKVCVPDYYFKAFLINHAGCFHTVAFLCPNNSNVVTIDSVVCSVNVVESASGLDLFEFLDDYVEESIESRFDLDMFLKTNK